MREIKFRAWDKKKKEWFGESDDDSLTFYGFGIFGECTEFFRPSVDYLQHLEITQFTGLKDKNGKEIYEGDILKKHDQKSLVTVKYNQKCCAFRYSYIKVNYQFDIFKSETILDEVIGNIYEDKELLK